MSAEKKLGDKSFQSRSVPKSVVTGQQLGLLGGPLFSIYKLLGALHQANKYSLKAIYWLETHDADFSEANSLSFIDKNQIPRRLVWKKKTKGIPMGEIEIDKELCHLLRHAFDLFPASEHLKLMKNLVLKVFREKRTLGAATEELFSYCFKDFPIHFFNPNQKEFHEFSKPYLLNEANRTPIGSQCNLFALIDGVRTGIFRSSQHQFTTRSGKPVSLARHILLPNLKTRPVLQDAYLNAQFYIAGPSEALYLKELKEVYAFHKVLHAQVQKRMSLTWLTSKQADPINHLKKWGISLEDLLYYPTSKLLYKLIHQKTGKDLHARKHHLKHLKTTLVEELKLPYSSIHTSTKPHLKKIEFILYKEMKHLLGLERKEAKEKIRVEADLLKTLTYHLKPFNEKQERALNWFPYLCQYGPSFIKILHTHHEFKEMTQTLPFH